MAENGKEEDKEGRTSQPPANQIGSAEKCEAVVCRRKGLAAVNKLLVRSHPRAAVWRVSSPPTTRDLSWLACWKQWHFRLAGF